MTPLLAVLALGFFLGMRHATDPDHVLAVTTIVAKYRSLRDAAVIGVCWGVGHTFTVLIVGGGIILFGWVIPPRVGLSMEFAVGVMLVLLGILTLRSTLQRVDETVTSVPATPHDVHDGHGHDHRPHSHAHAHGDYIHTHPHSHAQSHHPHPPDKTPVAWLDRHFGRLGVYQWLRPIVVGMVHGLAGSAAVALLVLTTIRTPRWSVFYLVVFGFGTIVGMMLVTAAIAIPFASTRRRFGRLNRGLRLASGLISLAFGLFLAYQVGIVDGLFAASPSWVPR
jgi:high-affinity nickel-transport protein